jgi:hypothetical protein
MHLDWYQERTKDEATSVGGWAAAAAYDFDLPGDCLCASNVQRLL